MSEVWALKGSEGAQSGAEVSQDQLAALARSSAHPGEALAGGAGRGPPHFLILQLFHQQLKLGSPTTAANQGLPILPPAAPSNAVQGRRQPHFPTLRVSREVSKPKQPYYSATVTHQARQTSCLVKTFNS